MYHNYELITQHDPKVDPKKVCGLYIKEARKEDGGEWK